MQGQGTGEGRGLGFILLTLYKSNIMQCLANRNHMEGRRCSSLPLPSICMMACMILQTNFASPSSNL